ncbi:MAG: hypothetical protein FJ254_10175, partial [Phycisphaerae bacterium]|nr:hypothetical protein [Phycisphaerae bacterium]
MKRTIVTFVVVAIATTLVFTIISGGGRTKSEPERSSQVTPTTDASASSSATAPDATATAPAASTQAPAGTTPATPGAPQAAAPGAAPAATTPPAPVWTAIAPASGSGSLIVGGPLTSADARIQLELTPRGAGIARVVFAHQWKTAKARIAAERAMAGKGEFPSDDERYRLEPIDTLDGKSVPLLAVNSIVV